MELFKIAVAILGYGLGRWVVGLCVSPTLKGSGAAWLAVCTASGVALGVTCELLGMRTFDEKMALLLCMLATGSNTKALDTGYWWWLGGLFAVGVPALLIDRAF